MSKSLIQVANPSGIAVLAGGIIPLGSVQRRFGCNLRLSGNAIEAVGEGYYTIDASVTITPTGAGAVTVALYNNGQPLPGASATATGTAAAPLTISLPPSTIRQRCCADADNLTLVLVEGPGTVNNVALRAEKV